jgi:hypothetical protein
MKLGKELAAHLLAGPFSSPQFDSFRLSPLDLVPKETPGDFRLIYHFPRAPRLTMEYPPSIQAYIMIKRRRKWLFFCEN